MVHHIGAYGSVEGGGGERNVGDVALFYFDAVLDACNFHIAFQEGFAAVFDIVRIETVEGNDVAVFHHFR